VGMEQDNTKTDPIKNSDTGMCNYSYGSGQGNVHILWKGNDTLGSIKGKQLLDKLSYLFIGFSTSWSQFCC
jgi:hypothetical protein